VGEAASAISTHPGVRRRLVALQQEAARHWGGVLEGRDIGTRVFPDTPHKFFLDARLDVRVRRRHDELLATGRDLPYDQVLDEIQRRDHRDRTREDSPLTHDDTYTLVDTSDLVIDQVVEAMAEAVRART
jgi:cytidylate kinase